MRARYYDPKAGRFLGEDPLPDVNLYPYVNNSPVDLTDPFGLFQGPLPEWMVRALTVAGAGAAAAGLAPVAAILAGFEVLDNPASTAGPEDDELFPWGVNGPMNPNVRSSRRGQGDPISGLGPYDPGTDDCGRCKPCPPPWWWEAPGNAHGSTGGKHYHWIQWDQTPDCICHPTRRSGPTPPYGGLQLRN
ncbi:MAG: RHS repeat-associated core domain-containing protein [Pseudomonadota bacterium]